MNAKQSESTMPRTWGASPFKTGKGSAGMMNQALL